MKWLTPEIIGIASFVVLLIGSVVKFTRDWSKDWKDRILAQDRRLEIHDDRLTEHDIELAEITRDISYIKETSGETRKDVKTLLRLANGRNNGTA